MKDRIEIMEQMIPAKVTGKLDDLEVGMPFQFNGILYIRMDTLKHQLGIACFRVSDGKTTYFSENDTIVDYIRISIHVIKSLT